MTAVHEPVTLLDTKTRTIDVYLNLSPIIGLTIDADVAAAPGAAAAYARYGSRYLDAVERLVTANSVPNLDIQRHALLMADDEHFQVDTFATLTFPVGSETDRMVEHYHEAHDKAKERFQHDNATRIINDHLAEYISGLAQECGYHFRFAADYRW